MFTFLQYILIISIVSGLLYIIVAAIIARLQLSTKAKPAQDNFLPAVSILKPLKGLDDQLDENLRTFFEIDYPQFELLFAVADASDPAIQVVRHLMDAYPRVKVKLITGSGANCYNPKIANLNNAYAYSEFPYVMISDSNTRLQKDTLRCLAGRFENKKTGLVAATIRGIGAGNIASLMENLHLNAYIMPNIFAVDKLFKVKLAIGKCLLLKKETLEQMGGFFSFHKYLAEDYMMAQKVKAMGYDVITAPVLIDTVNKHWSMDHFLNRHTRWGKMRKTINWKHYLIEAFGNPVSASFLLALLWHGTWYGVTQLLLVSVIKSLIDYSNVSLMRYDLRWYHFALVPLKDLLIGLLWFIPLFSNTVDWRGNQFKIIKNSELVPSYRR